MKTPIQELIDRLNNVNPQDFCSIETIKGWAESLLDVEKDTFIHFGDRISYLNYGDEGDSNLVWCEMFNNDER